MTQSLELKRACTPYAPWQFIQEYSKAAEDQACNDVGSSIDMDRICETLAFAKFLVKKNTPLVQTSEVNLQYFPSSGVARISMDCSM
eukprot:4645423-Amphidinium_carterae.1